MMEKKEQIWQSQSVPKAERQNRGSRAPRCAVPLGVPFASPGSREALQPEDFHLFQEANKMEKNCVAMSDLLEISIRVQDTAMTMLFLQVCLVQDVQTPSKLKLVGSST